MSYQCKYVSGIGLAVILLLLFSGIGWGDQQSAAGTEVNSLSAPAEPEERDEVDELFTGRD